MQNGAYTLEDSLAASYKAKHSFTIWSSNHTPRYRSNWVENFMLIFMASLFAISKNWKLPRVLSAVEWRNKLWDISKMEYYSAIRNELSSDKKTWGNLKWILLSERSQSKKATDYMIPTIWNSGKGKMIEMVKRSVIAIGKWGRWSIGDF